MGGPVGIRKGRPYRSGIPHCVTGNLAIYRALFEKGGIGKNLLAGKAAVPVLAASNTPICLIGQRQSLVSAHNHRDRKEQIYEIVDAKIWPGGRYHPDFHS